MSVRILQGDMREKLAEIADSSIDSIVTDPPYGLKFMGKGWDRGVPGVEFWALLLRVAKPGAHLLAFGGTRTFHRLWCAVEDAGWEIRDTILWLHGEGFPKSSNQDGEWQGWGTALKPAFEPILMARKPLVGTVAENLQAHGIGALNIDACRVEAQGRPQRDKVGNEYTGSVYGAGRNTTKANGSTDLGRWPANVLHDGSDEVVAAFPAEAGAAVPVTRRGSDKFRSTFGAFSGQEEVGHFHGDSGSAARFFWCPKASRTDREEGLEAMPERPRADVMSMNSHDHEGGIDGRGKPYKIEPVKNNHPTVKPTELMQYLVRLVTPRDGVVLDPFMGSGSTGKAAMREGMSFIGIEIDPAYIEIAKRRIVGVAPLFAEVSA